MPKSDIIWQRWGLDCLRCLLNICFEEKKSVLNLILIFKRGVDLALFVKMSKLIGVIDAGTNKIRFVLYKTSPNLEEFCSHEVNTFFSLKTETECYA